MNIIDELKKIEGTVGYYYKNLITGEVVGLRENEEYHPASMIKLPILMAIVKMASEGRVLLSEKIQVKYENRVPSCGAFNSFTDEPLVDIETLCKLMIVISDNTAANLLIKRFGAKELAKELRDIGFKKTRVERCFYDDEMQEAGFNNKIVPKEMGEQLEKLYKKEFINEETSEYILNIMKEQQHTDFIPSFFGNEYVTANKTGGTSRYTGDEGIIYCNEPFVYVVISNDTYVAETNIIYAKISKELYERDKIDGNI